MKDKTITLPIGDYCVINLTDPDDKGRYSGGSISTSWQVPESDIPESLAYNSGEVYHEDELYNIAIDGIEALVMAHAIAGIDVESPAYIEGIETAIEGAVANC